LTALAAGAGGTDIQYAEGVVVSTTIAAGGSSFQHCEGLVSR